ncbi:MAG: Ppx/GppA family phosphatase [Alphaproteobacteria bacterium]
MDGDPHLGHPVREHDDSRVAVIDIGSNSVRLVVYDGRGRASQVIFNEKAICALSAGVSKDGLLCEQGIACVTGVLGRFVRICHALDVTTIDAFATAATRDAANGGELIDRIRALCGLDVAVLSGEQEARLSAEGVIASMPGVDGAMGDLGGGSMEVVALDKGAIGACATLPVGVLQMMAAHGNDIAALRKFVRKALVGPKWFTATKGRTFVAVGGAWRALARVYMNVNQVPLHIVQGLTVDAGRLKPFLTALMKGGHQDEAAVRGLSRRRVEALPVAAALLSEVIARGRPASVTFSAYGVREGRLMRHLPEQERARDPLYAACADLSSDTPRFRLSADEVFHWMSSLFVDEPADRQRLRYAACLVGDIGWREHPDYRPEQVFRRLLLLPAVGIDHAGRAFFATTVYARYTHHFEAPCLAPARALLSDDAFEAAALAGGALRLAYEMSGGDPEVLRMTRLERGSGALVLHLSEAVTSVIGDGVERRLGQIAKRVGLKAELRRIGEGLAA